MGRLATLRAELGPPNCKAGLVAAYKSPASARPGIDVKMPIGIVLQAADGSVPAEEGQDRAHAATDAEIDGIARQMARMRGSANAGIVMSAAAGGIHSYRAEV